MSVTSKHLQLFCHNSLLVLTWHVRAGTAFISLKPLSYNFPCVIFFHKLFFSNINRVCIVFSKFLRSQFAHTRRNFHRAVCICVCMFPLHDHPFIIVRLTMRLIEVMLQCKMANRFGLREVKRVGDGWNWGYRYFQHWTLWSGASLAESGRCLTKRICEFSVVICDEWQHGAFCYCLNRIQAAIDVMFPLELRIGKWRIKLTNAYDAGFRSRWDVNRIATWIPFMSHSPSQLRTTLLHRDDYVQIFQVSSCDMLVKNAFIKTAIEERHLERHFAKSRNLKHCKVSVRVTNRSGLSSLWEHTQSLLSHYCSWYGS